MKIQPTAFIIVVALHLASSIPLKNEVKEFGPRVSNCKDQRPWCRFADCSLKNVQMACQATCNVCKMGNSTASAASTSTNTITTMTGVTTPDNEEMPTIIEEKTASPTVVTIGTTTVTETSTTTHDETEPSTIPSVTITTPEATPTTTEEESEMITTLTASSGTTDNPTTLDTPGYSLVKNTLCTGRGGGAPTITLLSLYYGASTITENIEECNRRSDCYGIHDGGCNGEDMDPRTLVGLCIKSAGSDWTVSNGDCVYKKENIVGNKKDYRGFTPLYVASKYGDLPSVELLLQYGADVNELTNGGQTPLYAASFSGYTKIVQHLLTNNADVDKKNDRGDTPLYVASRNGHLPSVELLLQYGANVNEPNNDGATPLIVACQEGHLEVVQHLLNNNANLFWKKKDNGDCAFSAARNGHLEILKLILPPNPSLIQRRLFKGFTILHAAAYHYSVTEFILSFEEADSILNNKSNTFSQTPLTLAIQFEGDLELVKLLILKGADPHLTGYKNKTPLEWAEEKNKEDIAEYLRNL